MRKVKQIQTPTALVLFGATGDLSMKKLLPALMDLYVANTLPQQFHVIAVARTPHTTDAYQALVRDALEGHAHGYTSESISNFVRLFEFHHGPYSERITFVALKRLLYAYDERIGICASKLFYLATPPTSFEEIFEQIAAANLGDVCTVGRGWTRILVEKPFGTDHVHAQRLEAKLRSLFRDEQIYRIDHYLAKDAIQNILAFRFSNILFQDNWNHNYVEAVYIKLFESRDVANRGAFFDSIGALRDVGQNHMLQMLALVAMEKPTVFKAVELRARRAEVVRALVPPTDTNKDTVVVRGQYTGYTSVPDVAERSTTETYFALKTYIANERWHNVPFYLEHGKALANDRIEISVRFRSSVTCVCGEKNPHNHANILRFGIKPDQKISVRFWVRSPSMKYDLEPNDLVFDREASQSDHSNTVIADAYEEVLFDAIRGGQTLFVSSEEQEAAWSYISKLTESWKNAALLPYEKGTEGPTSALKDEIYARFHL